MCSQIRAVVDSPIRGDRLRGCVVAFEHWIPVRGVVLSEQKTFKWSTVGRSGELSSSAYRVGKFDRTTLLRALGESRKPQTLTCKPQEP